MLSRSLESISNEEYMNMKSYEVEQTSLVYSGAFKDNHIITDITFFLLLAHSSGALAHVSEPSSGPEQNLSSDSLSCKHNSPVFCLY